MSDSGQVSGWDFRKKEQGIMHERSGGSGGGSGGRAERQRQRERRGYRQGSGKSSTTDLGVGWGAEAGGRERRAQWRGWGGTNESEETMRMEIKIRRWRRCAASKTAATALAPASAAVFAPRAAGACRPSTRVPASRASGRGRRAPPTTATPKSLSRSADQTQRMRVSWGESVR